MLKEMEKGPNKIIITTEDLTFISSRNINKSVRVGGLLILGNIT